MSKIKEYLLEKKDALIDFCDRHPWVVPTIAAVTLGAFTINEVGNHNAMEHGYNRVLKVGNLETGVCKNNSLPKP